MMGLKTWSARVLATKFDVDPSEVAFDENAQSLEMTVRPLLSIYDEAALIWLGWGLMAGSLKARRLAISIEPEEHPAQGHRSLTGIA